MYLSRQSAKQTILMTRIQEKIIGTITEGKIVFKQTKSGTICQEGSVAAAKGSKEPNQYHFHNEAFFLSLFPAPTATHAKACHVSLPSPHRAHYTYENTSCQSIDKPVPFSLFLFHSFIHTHIHTKQYQKEQNLRSTVDLLLKAGKPFSRCSKGGHKPCDITMQAVMTLSIVGRNSISEFSCNNNWQSVLKPV